MVTEDVINVTIPVQCLVEESSRIILYEGSKSGLAGFFDPCNTDDEDDSRHLLIRYSYQGKIHQTLIKDQEQLRCPRSTHQLLNSQCEIRNDHHYKQSMRKQTRKVRKNCENKCSCAITVGFFQNNFKYLNFPRRCVFVYLHFEKLAKKTWLLYSQDFFAIVQQILLHYYVRILNLSMFSSVF